jgi:hypothetical protein
MPVAAALLQATGQGAANSAGSFDLLQCKKF